ncbi:MAG: hypothetical protein JXA16_01975 [Bacteroidales bacterium]|nr:hypothetical protein [Bacteroidales bacterium]
MKSIAKNKTTLVIIAIAVIVLIFFLLDRGHWMHGRMYYGINWMHILISLAIGFVIGLLVAKRKR